MSYVFEVLGNIKGKGRPRLNTTTGFIYTPKDTKDYESLIKQYFNIRYPRAVPLEGRVKVKIDAYFLIPKKTTKKDIKLIEEGVLSPTTKPDIDNVIKVVLDSLNKIAFKDDNQITKIEVEKHYTFEREEKIIIEIDNY